MYRQAAPTESRSPPARSVTPLSPGERALLDGFVRRVVDAFGTDGLDRIVVFGSRARGAGHVDSDLDVAVLMHSASRAGALAVGHRLGELAAYAQIGWEELAPLRPALLDSAHPRSPRERALLQAIAREGIVLWPNPTT
jgi:predicted nucleotidyltransferase